MKIEFIIAILFFTGCSTLSQQTDYNISDTSETAPVCSIWNSKNGAAFTSILESAVLVKAPAQISARFFGPILLPFIPVLQNDKNLNAHIEIQFVPKEGDSISFQISQTEVFFDGKKIDIDHVQYRTASKFNNERTYGTLKKDQFSDSIKIDKPYSITLEGGSQSTPQNIELALTLARGIQKETRIFKFNREINFEYKPLIIPGMELDSVCMTTIPNLGKKRDLL